MSCAPAPQHALGNRAGKSSAAASTAAANSSKKGSKNLHDGKKRVEQMSNIVKEDTLKRQKLDRTTENLQPTLLLSRSDALPRCKPVEHEDARCASRPPLQQLTRTQLRAPCKPLGDGRKPEGERQRGVSNRVVSKASGFHQPTEVLVNTQEQQMLPLTRAERKRTLEVGQALEVGQRLPLPVQDLKSTMRSSVGVSGNGFGDGVGMASRSGDGKDKTDELAGEDTEEQTEKDLKEVNMLLRKVKAALDKGAVNLGKTCTDPAIVIARLQQTLAAAAVLLQRVGCSGHSGTRLQLWFENLSIDVLRLKVLDIADCWPTQACTWQMQNWERWRRQVLRGFDATTLASAFNSIFAQLVDTALVCPLHKAAFDLTPASAVGENGQEGGKGQGIAGVKALVAQWCHQEVMSAACVFDIIARVEGNGPLRKSTKDHDVLHGTAKANEALLNWVQIRAWFTAQSEQDLKTSSWCLPMPVPLAIFRGSDKLVSPEHDLVLQQPCESRLSSAAHLPVKLTPRKASRAHRDSKGKGTSTGRILLEGEAGREARAGARYARSQSRADNPAVDVREPSEARAKARVTRSRARAMNPVADVRGPSGKRAGARITRSQVPADRAAAQVLEPLGARAAAQVTRSKAPADKAAAQVREQSVGRRNYGITSSQYRATSYSPTPPLINPSPSPHVGRRRGRSQSGAVLADMLGNEEFDKKKRSRMPRSSTRAPEIYAAHDSDGAAAAAEGSIDCISAKTNDVSQQDHFNMQGPSQDSNAIEPSVSSLSLPLTASIPSVSHSSSYLSDSPLLCSSVSFCTQRTSTKKETDLVEGHVVEKQRKGAEMVLFEGDERGLIQRRQAQSMQRLHSSDHTHVRREASDSARLEMSTEAADTTRPREAARENGPAHESLEVKALIQAQDAAQLHLPVLHTTHASAHDSMHPLANQMPRTPSQRVHTPPAAVRLRVSGHTHTPIAPLPRMPRRQMNSRGDGGGAEASDGGARGRRGGREDGGRTEEGGSTSHFIIGKHGVVRQSAMRGGMGESVGGIQSCVGGMESRLAPASIDILDICLDLDSHQSYPPRARSNSTESAYSVAPLGYPEEERDRGHARAGTRAREHERDSESESERGCYPGASESVTLDLVTLASRVKCTRPPEQVKEKGVDNRDMGHAQGVDQACIEEDSNDDDFVADSEGEEDQIPKVRQIPGPVCSAAAGRALGVSVVLMETENVLCAYDMPNP